MSSTNLEVPTAELSKTERRRIAKAKKKAKKNALRSDVAGTPSSSRSEIPTTGKKKAKSKEKITKSERKEKYTQIARERADKKYESKRDKNLTCFNCRQKVSCLNER